LPFVVLESVCLDVFAAINLKTMTGLISGAFDSRNYSISSFSSVATVSSSRIFSLQPCAEGSRRHTGSCSREKDARIQARLREEGTNHHYHRKGPWQKAQHHDKHRANA
jgi:hypothetical protein